MNDPRRCLRLALILPALLAMPVALAVSNHHPPHRLKVATMAPTTASPTAWANLAPVPHPADVAARQASDARDVALVGQWGEAKAANDAQAAAVSAAIARKLEQETRNHEANAPRLGGSTGGGSAPGGAWDCIRAHESGNNYGEAGGGAYQFLDSTWHSLGYSGSAQNASPATQDAAAVALQARSGWGQWTTAAGCGVG